MVDDSLILVLASALDLIQRLARMGRWLHAYIFSELRSVCGSGRGGECRRGAWKQGGCHGCHVESSDDMYYDWTMKSMRTLDVARQASST